MIEKLKKQNTWGECLEKLNEVIDVVNVLVYKLDKDSGWYNGKATVEPADPYAEQRKWIRKVCRFWDDDNTDSSCGILTSIDTETFKEPQFVCNDEYDYEHCEPVKPDDDIIYKGGKDE